MRRETIRIAAVCGLLLMAVGFVGLSLRAAFQDQPAPVKAIVAAPVLEAAPTKEKESEDYAYPGTRYWKAGNNIWGMETPSACVFYNNYAIAILPKTQMPQGTGCQ